MLETLGERAISGMAYFLIEENTFDNENWEPSQIRFAEAVFENEEEIRMGGRTGIHCSIRLTGLSQ